MADAHDNSAIINETDRANDANSQGSGSSGLTEAQRVENARLAELYRINPNAGELSQPGNLARALGITSFSAAGGMTPEKNQILIQARLGQILSGRAQNNTGLSNEQLQTFYMETRGKSNAYQSAENIRSANRLLPSINLKLEGKLPLTGGETYLSLFKSKQTLEGAISAESEYSGVDASFGYNPKLYSGLEAFGAYYQRKQAQVTPELAFAYSSGKVQMNGVSVDVSQEYQNKYIMPSFEDLRQRAISLDVEAITGTQNADRGYFITPKEGGGSVGLLSGSKSSYFNIFERGVKEAKRTGLPTYIGGMGITYSPTIMNYGEGIINETSREAKARGYTAEEGRQFEMVKTFGRGEHPITLNMQYSVFGRTRGGVIGARGMPDLMTTSQTGYVINTRSEANPFTGSTGRFSSGVPIMPSITQGVMFKSGGMAIYEKSKTEAWNYAVEQANNKAASEAASSTYAPATNETTNVVSQTADKYSSWIVGALGTKGSMIGSLFPFTDPFKKSKGGVGLLDATGFLAKGGRNYIIIADAGKQYGIQNYDVSSLPLRLTGGLLQAPDYAVREMLPYSLSRGAVTYQFAGETLYNKYLMKTPSDFTTQFFEFAQFESKKPILYESIINLAAGSGVLGGITKTGTATFASLTPAPEVASATLGGFIDVGFKGIYAISMVMAPEETMKSTGLLMAPSLSQNLPAKWFNVELMKGKPLYQGFVSQLAPFEGNVVGRVNGKWVIGQGSLASTIKAQPNEFFVGRFPEPQTGGTKAANIADVMNFAQYKTYKTGIYKPISEKYNYPEMYNRLNVMEGLSRTAYNLPEPAVQQDIPNAIRSSDWFQRDLTLAQQNKAINYFAKARTGLEYYGGTALKTTNPSMKGAGETDIDVMMRNSLGNVLSVNNPGRFNRGAVKAIGGKNIRVSSENPNAVEVYTKNWKALGEKGPWVKRFDVHGMFGEPLPSGTIQLGSGEGIGFGLPAKPEMMTPRGYFIMRPSEQIVRYFSSAVIPRMAFTGTTNGRKQYEISTGGEPKRVYRAASQLDIQAKEPLSRKLAGVVNKDEINYAKSIGFEYSDKGLKGVSISAKASQPKAVYRMPSISRASVSRSIRSISPRSISPSMSRSISPSRSPSLSRSMSRSLSQSISMSKSPSMSRSISQSLSRSISMSRSPSMSRSISPSMSISPSLSKSMSPSMSPSPSIPKSPEKFGFPTLPFPIEKARRKGRKGKRGTRKFGYEPSLTAGIFNITGKVSRSILSGKQQISGLELRPLVRGGRKTRFKMGRFR